MRSAEDWAEEALVIDWAKSSERDQLINVIERAQREAASEMRLAATLTYQLMRQVEGSEEPTAEKVIEAIRRLALPGDEE